ncbi:MAG: hypothetical protein IJ219_03320 [Bacteroidaceae bacterium]|nr:hypothetical protein [Bacteroidaceae bacterium]
MLKRGFESLPTGMSVYNAFVQANLGVVKVYITKTMRLNGGSVLAPYQITRGTLPSIPMGLSTDGLLMSGLSVGSLSIDAATTIGAFSEAILAGNFGWQEGDQLSFFHGVQTVDQVTGIPRATITGYRVVINTADETPLWDVVNPIGFSTVASGSAGINVIATSQAIQSGAGVWVHSRETDSGLKVSTQFFYVENAALATYQSSAAQVASANSYGGINTSQVFLQPSVSGSNGVANVNLNANDNQSGSGSGTDGNDNPNENQGGTGGNTGGNTGGDGGDGDDMSD